MFLLKRRSTPQEEHLIALRLEIEKTEKELAVAYSNFQNVTEPELIDFYIYQVNAIQMKHQFLLREWKKCAKKTEDSYAKNPLEASGS